MSFPPSSNSPTNPENISQEPPNIPSSSGEMSHVQGELGQMNPPSLPQFRQESGQIPIQSQFPMFAPEILSNMGQLGNYLSAQQSNKTPQNEKVHLPVH